jgi:cell division septum initiation protein DivIVA
MPAPINEIVKRRVIQQWLSGEARAKIAIDNNVGEGTVSSIISYFKLGLDDAEFDSARELALEVRKQGLTLSELSSRVRLYNFIKSSGASEDQIEAFIANVISSDVSPENIVQYVNQLFAVSREQSVPLDQVPNYIEQKLEEKQKIDDQIKEADATLQSKNVSIETINEHIQLNEELSKYRLSTEDIHRLVNLLLAAKEYRYSPGKIVAKLRSIKGLENKENKLKNSCDVLSKQADKYKGIIPLANIIWDLRISKNELISFKIAVNEAAELFGFPRSTAAVYVLNNLREYNKKGQLKKELSSLYLQKYAVNEFCSRHSQVIIALANLQTHGITEEQIMSVNNFMESNGYKASSYTTTK